jgi:chromosome segregation ATPase
MKRSPMFSNSSSSSSKNVVAKTKTIKNNGLQAELKDRNHQINELKKTLYNNKTNQTDEMNPEIIFLRTKLEQAEHLANEYKAQLHTQTLKTSANNSRNHLSEIELEKIRVRLQKRIEELEPLPELLKQAELKNEKLQKRLSEQSNYLTQPTLLDRFKDNHLSSDDDNRTLQR